MSNRAQFIGVTIDNKISFSQLEQNIVKQMSIATQMIYKISPFVCYRDNF